ncbi:MAG TPA: response regulator, partial [Methylomirabilota bacterium]|nr:response regulator [Methylomirabilota bacterium]
ELFPAITSIRDSVRPVETLRDSRLPKVLIADDEPDMLRFLRSQLQTHYQIIEAVDGQQAIDKASQFLPDVILLDMMMPEKDGLQACRELRERTPTRSIPVILLTARADEETKLNALAAGASDFLPKPFSTTELHVRVKNLVESLHFQRQLARNNQQLEETIERLKETETQLVQAEKLASLGRMSAGIIHEINNPLNYASTGLYTLRQKGALLAPGERTEYEEVLRDIEEGLERVRGIVMDLRSFSHCENEKIDPVPVREIVQTTLRFLSHELKDQVEVTVDVPPDQLVEGNKNKLVQVLVNLVQNSVDALKRKAFDTDNPAIRLEGRMEGGKSVIVVQDNGEGIDAKNLDKIFDPFFTTKDVGEGMGLGLSIVYRIVQQFGGVIRVQSERGRYTRFTLEFPAPANPARYAEPPVPAESKQP